MKIATRSVFSLLDGGKIGASGSRGDSSHAGSRLDRVTRSAAALLASRQNADGH